MFRMKGVVPPLITPFREDGEIDWKALEAQMEFMRETVDGVFIAGSYGSGALMNVAERKRLAEEVIRLARGEIDVIVMTGSTNCRDTMDLSQHAKACGACAVSAVGPYYYKHTEDSICRFYEDMVKAVGENYPVYVYNNPQFQGYPMDIGLIQRLRDLGVTGIKDATFDILLHAQYHRLMGSSFDVVLGTEAMWMAASTLGCRAFVPGLGNVFPEICRKMYDEALSGDYAACQDTQFKVNRLRDIMYLAGSTQLAIYAMLSLRGIIDAFPRAPFAPAAAEKRESIRRELVELGML